MKVSLICLACCLLCVHAFAERFDVVFINGTSQGVNFLPVGPDDVVSVPAYGRVLLHNLNFPSNYVEVLVTRGADELATIGPLTFAAGAGLGRTLEVVYEPDYNGNHLRLGDYSHISYSDINSIVTVTSKAMACGVVVGSFIFAVRFLWRLFQRLLGGATWSD